LLDVDAFRQHQEDYTIVDIRNASEVKAGKFFGKAINIPLPELRERAGEIPTAKPIVVHCAGGYRSAAGSSIVEAALPEANVMDLSEAVNDFKNK
jgi:hydroxyacylglutathione hydrolase